MSKVLDNGSLKFNLAIFCDKYGLFPIKVPQSSFLSIVIFNFDYAFFFGI